MTQDCSIKSFNILAILIAAITESQRSTKSIRLAEKTFCMVIWRLDSISRAGPG